MLQKILLVDDKVENLIALETVLDEPYRILDRALSGQEALSLLMKDHYALILLDVQMPEMDGFEVARLIRRNKKTRDIPIIFVTAISKEQQYVFEGYDSGAVDYLFKPLDPMVIEAKVKFFLELDKKTQQLEDSLRKIRTLKDNTEILLKSVGEGIIGIDTVGKINFVNPATTNILSTHRDSLLGKHIGELLKLPDQSVNDWHNCSIYTDCKDGRTIFDDKNIYIKIDTKKYPIEFTASPINTDDGEFKGVAFAFSDITSRKAYEQKLTQLAEYDSLTGLANRYLFTNLFRQSLSRSQRQGMPLGLLFIDLDKFKEVNDTHGHETGDKLLREVAKRINASTRRADTVCRLGGDEFIVLLETLDSSVHCSVIADKIIKVLSQAFNINGNEIYIGASIGIVTYPETEGDENELMKLADIAMYQAKEKGRNNYQFFQDSMQEILLRKQQLEKDLRIALAEDQLALHYQPQYDAKTKDIVGIEALVRWENNGIDIPPTDFIPIAEDKGLIIEIGERVIKKAYDQVSDWHSKGVTSLPITVSVNLTVKELGGVSIIETLAKLLQSTGIGPHQLGIEITEAMIMHAPDKLIKVLEDIAKMDIGIAIDDFGTGYSSFDHLKRMPVDTIKIDKVFTKDIDTDEKTQTIVYAIIQMGHALGHKVIAESVETEAQAEKLTELGVDILQGYFLARPMPAEEMESIFLAGQAREKSGS